jgi:hypothetical protein
MDWRSLRDTPTNNQVEGGESCIRVWEFDSGLGRVGLPVCVLTGGVGEGVAEYFYFADWSGAEDWGVFSSVTESE